MTVSSRCRVASQALVLAFGLVSAAAAFAQDKVVFQVADNDLAKWNLVLDNICNLQTGVGAEAADVELVACGPGVQLLKAESPIAGRTSEALGTKVKVVACENTMAANRLTRVDMLTDIGDVPSGVVEVMRKQQQGYAYIRP